jgi:acetyltransferase-like isoleucine patch superfamily enzyme
MPIGKDVQLGKDVRIHHPDLVNLYGCVVGDETRIGAFVEIQIGAKIGARCKIFSHSFICEGVTIEDEVFVGHGVMLSTADFQERQRRRASRWSGQIGKRNPHVFVGELLSGQMPLFCVESPSGTEQPLVQVRL